MKIYKADWTFLEITEMEADRLQGESVWFGGKRQARETKYSKFFHTRDGAIAHIRARLEHKIADAKSTVAFYEQKLAQFNNEIDK